MTSVSSPDLLDLCTRALIACGFTEENAGALARQTVLTEELGQPIVGVSHMFDYVDGIAGGRIDGKAGPTITTPAPTMIHVDGNGGLPQTGFDRAFDQFIETAGELGVCIFMNMNTTLCGSLGTFAYRVAEAGMVCFAATNGSPLVAGSGGTKAVYGTSPMAFSAPQSGDGPLLIDQSSSATAYVNIRAAAERGETIPTGWAIDKEGNDTADPNAAMEGTMLAFGGARGANIALMMEVLAAGLTGGHWSLDAGSFIAGDRVPGTGLFVMAIDPSRATSGFQERLGDQLRRLSGEFNVHIPGTAKAAMRAKAVSEGLEIDDAMMERLRSLVGD